MIEQIVSRVWWRRFLARNARPWRELDEFPRLSPDAQRRGLARRLLAQVHYFGGRADALPEWREAARITDPEELWRVWPSLPILDKKSLQQRFVPAEMQARFGLAGVVKSTGGSTGEPTHVLHDPGMTLAANAASTYTRLRMGWRPGMATVILWGAERNIGRKTNLRSRVYVRLLRDILVDGYELNQRTADLLAALIRKHRPVAIQGFTSMLAFAAASVLERSIRLPPASVHTAWNGGEMLYPEQSETFRQAFGVPILNRYGGRELSVMACQFNDGGGLQVLRPWVFLEVVDENGAPVPPGESGRLIWTSTICRGTPLLRYDIGDLGAFDTAHQSEAGITHLAELHGRFAGLLRLGNGKRINCIFWNHLFKEYPEIQQFQVVVKNTTGLELRFRGKGLSAGRSSELLRVLRNFVGEMPVRIVWVDRIPLTTQGKLVQVVVEQESGAAVTRF